MRADLLGTAAWTAAVAAGLSGLMVVAFDWSLAPLVLWGLIGTALWAGVEFVTGVRHQVPHATRLLTAPPDTAIDRHRRRPLRMLLVLPLFVGIAWLVDLWDLGPIFIPGQPAGYALANLVGAVLVGRWQSRHGGRVLLRWNGDEPELYLGST